jgi:hypothetical protein
MLFAYERPLCGQKRPVATVGYKELNESGEFVIPGFAKMSRP